MILATANYGCQLVQMIQKARPMLESSAVNPVKQVQIET